MRQEGRAALDEKIARLSPEKQKLLRLRLAGVGTHAFSDELERSRWATTFPLSQTQEAYQTVASYEPGVHKVMIDL